MSHQLYPRDPSWRHVLDIMLVRRTAPGARRPRHAAESAVHIDLMLRLSVYLLFPSVSGLIFFETGLHANPQGRQVLG